MIGVKYIDLLGSPWLVGSADPEKGMDCAGVVGCILKRLGHVRDADVFSKEDTSEGASLFARIGDTWKAATDEGDVIVSLAEEGQQHVSVMIRPEENLALTSAKRVGVVAVRSWSIQDVQAVYRRRP